MESPETPDIIWKHQKDSIGQHSHFFPYFYYVYMESPDSIQEVIISRIMSLVSIGFGRTFIVSLGG